ncbi:MAG: lactate utilization protein B/C [Bacteroidota bacterium]|nr:lactate utilization protein B/C [Bacteroidota bacterium]
MNFLKKLFGGTQNIEKPEDNLEEEHPTDNLSLDELFAANFIKNGGKFVYCDSIRDLRFQFENILEENDWFEKQVLCFEQDLFEYLSENKLEFQKVKQPSFLFVTCENLIAEDGSVLFSAKQIKHHKPNELPLNIVVLAKTSMIVPSKSDGLRRIKNKYKTDYPTNITALRYFKEDKTENFLNYGSVPKNLYLLLLEDL